ncbi:hypothetical protein [Streptomyces flavidovirens]
MVVLDVTAADEATAPAVMADLEKWWATLRRADRWGRCRGGTCFALCSSPLPARARAAAPGPAMPRTTVPLCTFRGDARMASVREDVDVGQHRAGFPPRGAESPRPPARRVPGALPADASRPPGPRCPRPPLPCPCRSVRTLHARTSTSLTRPSARRCSPCCTRPLRTHARLSKGPVHQDPWSCRERSPTPIPGRATGPLTEPPCPANAAVVLRETRARSVPHGSVLRAPAPLRPGALHPRASGAASIRRRRAGRPQACRRAPRDGSARRCHRPDLRAAGAA